jgi:hypothetical protein
MVALHQALLVGRPPAAALASARQQLKDDGPQGAALRAAFTCFGPP